MTSFWAGRAWTGTEEVHDVEITTSDGRIAEVRTGVTPAPGTVRLPGALLPGLVNAHSHAFHRTLRGRAGGTDFWTWRRGMYRVAEVIDPDSYRRLATAVFAEMALTGITAVGEFHYLHHRRSGKPYADANEMGHAVVEAALSAGLRITLLDTCYLTADVGGSPVAGLQKRFSDRSADRWIDRHRALQSTYAGSDDVVIGAAIHSVRAVPETVMAEVASASHGPLHVHVSEQPAEHAACREHYGRTPTQVLSDAGVLGPRTTAVHGVHTEPADRILLGRSGTGLCVCPTTEGDLGDGVAPVAEAVEAGIDISLGSDSHAVVDLFGEARTVEYNDRSRRGLRGIHSDDALLAMASAHGARSLGHDRWGLHPGAPADFVAVDTAGIRTAGTDDVARLVMTASAADVTDVVVGGRRVVAHREHVDIPDVGASLERAISLLWETIP